MVFTGLPCSFSLLCLISVFHGSIRCFFNKKNSLDLLWTRCVLGKPCGSPAAALSLLPALRPPHSVCFQVLLEIAAGQYNFYFILFYLKILFWEFFFLLFSPCSLLSTEVPQRPLPTVPTPSFTFRWPCSHGLSVEARGCLSRLLTSFAPHVPHHRALLLRVWGWLSWKEDVEVQQRVLGLSHSVICVY